MKAEKIPCKSMFSNGTEYEYFLETQCEQCTRFRKGRCKIYNAIEDARLVGEKAFPFDDLMELEQYAGKTCRSFTDQPIQRKPRGIRPLKGQIQFEFMSLEDSKDVYIL